MKIGIISDIHSHEKDENKKQGGYYFPSMPSYPVSQNPFEALKEVIQNDNIELDYILSPGDYAHQIDKKGLVSAWDQLKLIVSSTNARKLIGTIGNHDVDSRGRGDIFEEIKKMGDEFPVYQNPDRINYRTQLIDETFFTIRDTDLNAEFFILNSCFDHWDKFEASKGKIKKDKLALLKSKIDSSPSKIKILLVHHQPIVHETDILDTGDIIEGAQELIDSISNIDLLIHGHKHDFRFKQLEIYPKNLNILSSGSFSCFKTSLKTRVQNCFHIIQLESNILSDCINHGVIQTYLYDPANGWKYEKGFDEGFGCIYDFSKIENELLNIFENHELNYINWLEVISKKIELKYISRFQRLKVLNKIVNDKGIIRFNFDTFTLSIGDIILK